MSNPEELSAVAKAIIDSNLYMTLGTADASGRPWATPVYYAPASYREFVWVSSPDATHSRNIASRPEVAVVIFDSQTPIGTGQGVYMTALAEEVVGDDIARGIDIFCRRSEAHGGSEWTRADVEPTARHRLYRAVASEQFVLGPRDERIRIDVE